MTTIELERSAPPVRPPEWWERLGAWRGRFLTSRPRLVRLLQRVRATTLWVALLWVVVALVVMPEVRAAVRAYAGSVLLVVGCLLLLRTKTISWATTLRVFSVSVAWAAVIGLGTLRLVERLGLTPLSDGAVIALAGFLEESGKLVPLALVVVLVPGRARRFALADWALLGAASGAAFNAYEDALRQTLFPDRWTKAYSLNPWTSARFASDGGVAVSPGHMVWTMTAAMSIGLAIALWRRGGMRARVGSLVLAVGVVTLVVAEHAGYNARDVAPFWPAAAGAGFPTVVSGLWSASGHGRASTVLSIVLLVVCLAVDVDRRHRAGIDVALSAGARGRGFVGLVERAAAATARWGWAPVAVVLRALAQWWTDLVLVLAAHAREPGESRRAAVARGRLVAARVRGLRAEAMEVTTPGVEPRARRRFALTGGVLAALGAGLAVLCGGLMAAAIGDSLASPDDATYLAGFLDGAGTWWNGLDGWQQVAVGGGVAALVVLSGGSLGLALGVAGAATYGLTKAHGAATFVRNPGRATADYLSTTTPAEMLLDTGEFALTFMPASFAGAVAGKGLRVVGRELATDPAAFAARVRAQARGDLGEFDPTVWHRAGREWPVHPEPGTPEYALGWDPAVKQFRPIEYRTAVEVMDAKGVSLTRAPRVSRVDWFDENGVSYDAIGGFPSRFFDQQWSSFSREIVRHLQKADIVPVDVSAFTPDQVARVRDFVAQYGDRIIIVGG